MALLKNIEFKTLPVENAYHKIGEWQIHDVINSDGVKEYIVQVRVDIFIDATKTTLLEQKVIAFSSVSDSVNLKNVYPRLVSGDLISGELLEGAVSDE
jgi:hypothetical protein